MPKSPPIEFSTDRLLLRAARAEHAAGVFMEYTGNSKASRFLTRGPHPAQSRTEAVINAWGESNWTNSDRFVWSIIDRSSHRPIGLFLMFMEGDSAEIHYGLGPAFWGKGLATEAGLAVMRWVSEQSHLSSVHTTCAVAHDASRRVLEKIGLLRDQFVPEALLMKATDAKLDGWSYVWRRTD
ncbi:GNAT family N-acetyltransferase [Agrobacterium rhizogenes]|nr:GNAT family N-acetyltransferase [Rhizobium rhizogenes]NTI46243.1 GNAT family N-acetyltransferase [Rhizobium rhizogenes]NTI52926.1 GNAT family N-acetyltransferase [Rhizobium rhizogenes]NTI98299.1 GNAT family N-acetyltransferase [Rhizobium rhizogenes]NTJ60728.1 GNAT family N-acetyltransferase [Rhizobium rhizogenes]